MKDGGYRLRTSSQFAVLTKRRSRPGCDALDASPEIIIDSEMTGGGGTGSLEHLVFALSHSKTTRTALMSMLLRRACKLAC